MESKLDMYHMQCQFIKTDEKSTVMFGLFSKRLKKNISLFETEIKNLNNNISDYLKSKTSNQINTIRCRIEHNGDLNIEALNGMSIKTELNTMPEEYQTMYTKFILLKD